eukprot:scaffold613600_cov18-Prasinocladus_malaysianus.AAC.1
MADHRQIGQHGSQYFRTTDMSRNVSSRPARITFAGRRRCGAAGKQPRAGIHPAPRRESKRALIRLACSILFSVASSVSHSYVLG